MSRSIWQRLYLGERVATLVTGSRWKDDPLDFSEPNCRLTVQRDQSDGLTYVSSKRHIKNRYWDVNAWFFEEGAMKSSVNL